jgi:hypothetical protein
MNAPQFRVRELELFERDVRLRLPFRFGVVTLTQAPQCFVRARIEYPDGRTQWGAAAELLVPKWFDKNEALSNQDNFDQLRLSLSLAAQAYMQGGPARTAFGHFAAHHDAQIAQGRDCGLNPLIANFGPAQVDRAILDALGRIETLSFYDLIRRDLAGIDPALLPSHLPELAGFAMGRFLATLTPSPTLAARHTVGLVDIISGHPKQANDGLPESLEEVVAAYGHRYFKLKVGGNPAVDVERLGEIAAVLGRIETPYFASLDGNEQYSDIAAFHELWRRLEQTAALSRLMSSIIFIEQPVTRNHALANDVSGLSHIKPVIIDESDDAFTAFPLARELGYSGVSSKCCKGLYKSIINAARCVMWNAQEGRIRYFMSGEDLTTQSGLAVQQDLALVNLLGLNHVERNGHHYVNGMMDLSEAEQSAFLAAHPDLYERSHGAVRLRIRDGELAIASLAAPGFASGAYPDWATLKPCRVGKGSPERHRFHTIP